MSTLQSRIKLRQEARDISESIHLPLFGKADKKLLARWMGSKLASNEIDYGFAGHNVLERIQQGEFVTQLELFADVWGTTSRGKLLVQTLGSLLSLTYEQAVELQSIARDKEGNS